MADIDIYTVETQSVNSSIIIAVMILFVHLKDYSQLHDLTYMYVSPCVSKAKIRYSVTVKFIAGIR